MNSRSKAIYWHKSTIIIDRELLRNRELVERATLLHFVFKTLHNQINCDYCFYISKYIRLIHIYTTYSDH